MLCSNCKDKEAVAKKLCKACYSRLRRTGSLEKTNIPNTGVCLIDGCGQPVFGRGKCSLHYARSQHPLRNTWKLIRSRYPGQTPDHWARFDDFLAEIGERPSAFHQLRRIDDTRPYASDNVRWVEPVAKLDDYFTPDQRAAYVREWTLNRKYQIGRTKYGELDRSQDGKCAICCEPEIFVNPKTKTTQKLSVDHDHATGVTRGLLCVRCNRMLGYARDNKDIFTRAIAYLAKHESPPEA